MRQLTRQPPLSLIVRSRRLSLFGHVARMDDSADIYRLLFEQPAENWRRLPGRPHSTWLRNVADDLKELDMDLLDAGASAQNRPLWRIIAKHGATLP